MNRDDALPETLGHFTVVEKLGEGGMGVVYKAVDQRLHRAVALKVLRAGVAADHTQRQRFLREARAAAAIAHANIAAIYDVGEHEGRVFIAMELVPGTTLRALVEGGLAPDRAIAIIATVARALDRAHALGVVHRDLKPDNVMVTADGIVKVVDFGVARLGGEGGTPIDPRAAGHMATLAGATADGKLVGTPEYMAPEQAKGEAVDARTDIFALGVMLYEALTGARPFHAATLDGLLRAIVFETPARASSRMGVPDSRVDDVLARCLAKPPDLRYATAGDLARELEALVTFDGIRALPPVAELPSLRAPERPASEPRAARTATLDDTALVAAPPNGTTAPSAFAPPRRRWRTAVGTAVTLAALTALVAAVAIGVRMTGPRATSTIEPTRPLPRRSVAVLGFANAGAPAESAWFGAALDELVTRDLAAAEDVRTSAHDEVRARKRDLGLDGERDHGDGFAAADLTRLARALGVDVVVSGHFSTTGLAPARHIRLDVSAQSTADASTLTHVTETGTESDVAGLALRAATALRAGLGIKAATEAEVAAARASLPGDATAAELYADALGRVARFDAAGARVPLEALVARVPDFAEGHALFSDVLRTLRERKRAEAEAEKAFAASGPLGREEKLFIEARYHVAASRFDKARDLYRALYTFFPDDPRYGLALARTQISAGQAREGIATLDEMRKAPHADTQRAAIDLYASLAAAKLGDARTELDLAVSAIAESRARGLRALEATAHDHASEAAYALGDTARAEAEDAASEQLFAAIGDRAGVASRLRPRALRLIDRGDFVGARALLERALAVFTELGNHYDAAGIENALGQLEAAVGSLQKARAAYDRAASEYRAAGDREGVLNATSNDADVLGELGELSAAKRALEASVTAYRDLGMPNHAASTQVMLAKTLLAMGDLAASRRVVDEALRDGAKLGDHGVETDGRGVLGAWLYDSGDLEGARTTLGEQLARLAKAGETVGRVDALVTLARIAVDEGRRADADGHLADALAVADAGAPLHADAEGRVRAAMARALFARSDLAGAAREATRAADLTRTTESAFVRMDVALAVAEARGDVAALDAVVRSARAVGVPGIAFDAALAHAVALRAVDPAGGASARAAVARDADARGFGAVAARARAASRR